MTKYFQWVRLFMLSLLTFCHNSNKYRGLAKLVDILLNKQDNIAERKGVDQVALDAPSVNRQAIQKEVSRNEDPSKIEIIAGQTTLDPNTLKKMFLLGKLTQGQLAHELKKYNDVVADTIIKHGKQDKNQVIDYKTIARASVSNPGADLKSPQDDKSGSSAKTSKDAKKEEHSADNESKKKEIQKKEQKLKSEESQTQQRQLTQFTDAQKDQKQKQQSIEQNHKKKVSEKVEEEIEEDLSLGGKVVRGKIGRLRLTKNMAAEIKDELEKLKSGPGQSSK